MTSSREPVLRSWLKGWVKRRPVGGISSSRFWMANFDSVLTFRCFPRKSSSPPSLADKDKAAEEDDDEEKEDEDGRVAA